MSEPITIQTTVEAPIQSVWKSWNTPEDISAWAFASGDWGAESQENDLQPGGRFVTRMFAKDTGNGFNFSGTYDQVIENQVISYTLDDGRQVQTIFSEVDGSVHIVQTFEPEGFNDPDFQKQGWQAFLDNFKKHTEAKYG